jgi:hypothetical protein
VQDAVIRPLKRVLYKWTGEAYKIAKGWQFKLRDRVIILKELAYSSLSKLVIIKASKLVSDSL